MKTLQVASLLAISLMTTANAATAQSGQRDNDSLAWPQFTTQSKPWTRWWWMGNAVNPDDLTRELKSFQAAGLGGVEVTPIYGVKGHESQNIEYLSPKWVEMLNHTIGTAQGLSMAVDMPTNSGWCFGGPNVSDTDANASVVVKTFDVNAGDSLKEKFSGVQALVAFPPQGECVELTGKIGGDGTVDWTAEGGSWRVYAVSQKPSGVKVKRPAPGGEGWMLNLLYPDALSRYVRSFDTAFGLLGSVKLHAMFHDSYEYKSDWAPDFLAQFAQRRGYSLQSAFPAFFENKGDPDFIARVKSDYRQTVSELIEESIARWTKWSNERGWQSRNQAHGSPGNWLDIYAASDIPETEMFYKDRDILVSKFAASAANVTGKKLVGAETGTWVAEHFTETLADLKYLFDDMFLAEVNRITYHGTAYSPADAQWPGWCFYASTEMNPRNSIWRDVPALNTYAARVQSVLQNSKPDNDILLYWPIHDFWHNQKGTVQQLSVHARDWFDEQPIGKLARSLWRRGFTFDYVSDKQLANAAVKDGALTLAGNNYRVIVVPRCEHMPLPTLQKLLALADAGATVIFEHQLPQDVPGAADLEKRRSDFQALRNQVAFPDTTKSSPDETTRGKGRVLAGETEAALTRADVRRETLADRKDVHFVRRAFDGGHAYFIANRGKQQLDDWITLSNAAASAAILDPMTGRAGTAETRQHDGATQVRLQLDAGASLIVRARTESKTGGEPWKYWQPAGEPIELKGEWTVRFLEGGPVLPKEFTTAKLGSWTELGDEDAQRFGGAALYTITFDAPYAKAGKWSLDLGKVCQSARVRLNGKDLGTVFIPPFRVAVDELKPKGNVLEVEVTNVSANRIRDLDRRKVQWKIFHDINVVNLGYKPFDASNWPLTDSGLLGPVTLTPEKSAGAP